MKHAVTGTPTPSMTSVFLLTKSSGIVEEIGDAFVSTADNNSGLARFMVAAKLKRVPDINKSLHIKGQHDNYLSCLPSHQQGMTTKVMSFSLASASFFSSLF